MNFDSFWWRLCEHSIFAICFYFAVQGHWWAIAVVFVMRVMLHEVHFANTTMHDNAINKNADALQLLYDKVAKLERKCNEI